MSLDGLRAWIGEVERKLGMRTRVFLVLSVIAIGIGGAAIYLAIDARDNSVSKDDVQALQEQLEGQIGVGGGGAAGAEVVQLEAELEALQAEVAALKSEGGESSPGKKGSADSGRDSGEGSSNGGGREASGGTVNGATGGAASAARLQELLDRAKAESEESE